MKKNEILNKKEKKDNYIEGFRRLIEERIRDKENKDAITNFFLDDGTNEMGILIDSLFDIIKISNRGDYEILNDLGRLLNGYTKTDTSEMALEDGTFFIRGGRAIKTRIGNITLNRRTELKERVQSLYKESKALYERAKKYDEKRGLGEESKKERIHLYDRTRDIYERFIKLNWELAEKDIRPTKETLNVLKNIRDLIADITEVMWCLRSEEYWALYPKRNTKEFRVITRQDLEVDFSEGKRLDKAISREILRSHAYEFFGEKIIRGTSTELPYWFQDEVAFSPNLGYKKAQLTEQMKILMDATEISFEDLDLNIAWDVNTEMGKHSELDSLISEGLPIMYEANISNEAIYQIHDLNEMYERFVPQQKISFLQFKNFLKKGYGLKENPTIFLPIYPLYALYVDKEEFLKKIKKKAEQKNIDLSDYSEETSYIEKFKVR